MNPIRFILTLFSMLFGGFLGLMIGAVAFGFLAYVLLHFAGEDKPFAALDTAFQLKPMTWPALLVIFGYLGSAVLGACGAGLATWRTIGCKNTESWIDLLPPKILRLLALACSEVNLHAALSVDACVSKLRAQVGPSHSIANWFKTLMREGRPIIGTVSPAGIHLSVVSLAHNSFRPYLRAKLLPQNDNGTLIVGKIGPHPLVVALQLFLIVTSTLLTLLLLIATVVSQLFHPLEGLWIASAGTIVICTSFWLFPRFGKLCCHGEQAVLIRFLEATLKS